MSAKLEKLNEEQKQKMVEVRDYWIDKVYSGKTRLNKESAKDLVRFCYKTAGLEEPKHYIWLESPLGCALAKTYMNEISRGVGGLGSGASVRDSVWDSVGVSVWASVGDSVRDSVGDSVWASVWDSVGASVRDSVGDSVGNSVWASVGNSVRDSVRDSVWDSVWDSVGDSVGHSVRDSSWRGSISDYGWVSSYHYFVEAIKHVEHPLFSEYSNLLDKGNIFYWMPYKNIVFISDFPTQIHGEEVSEGRRVLHNEYGEAIKFADGWGFYSLKGIKLGKDLWEKITNKSLTFEEAINIENIEHRRLALEYLDPDSLLAGANAKIIHEGVIGEIKIIRTDWAKVTKEGEGYNQQSFFKNTKDELVQAQNILYEVKLPDWSQPYKCLRYTDPSTGRPYIAWVDSSEVDADEAMAKRHHSNKTDYLNIKQQA